jgi:class 3 adenylate cyclase/tetratricopeptide (TPR) repeat protein
MHPNLVPDTVVALRSYVSRLHGAWLAEDAPGRIRIEPGSLLFIDISGFTPLTERLARRGKVGAEELTEHLTTIFTSLMAAAERQGGDVLKFGGDALLLHFEGAGHELRAAAAAWDLQLLMRGVRRLRTSVGTVELRASAGIASGIVHAFSLGPWRDLVLAGPTADAVLAAEKAAAAGEVLVDASTAAALAPELLKERADGAGTLLRARPHTTSDLPPASLPAFDPLIALPPGIVPYLGGAAHNEHRLATVAFAQLAGTGAVLRDDGPDELCAELDAFVTRTQEACERHGVSYLGSDPDSDAVRVFLAAGAPVAGDRDEDAMLLALGEIVRAPSRLPARAGCNRGRVFALHIGAAHRRTYATMGDTTNLAARVSGKAPPRGVLATEAVLAHARAPFALTRVEPFAVKGKSEPVHAALVGDLLDESSAPAASGVVLVGRGPEQAQLAELLDRGGALELVGEPGIGKSALVEDLMARAHARGRRILRVDAAPYTATTPFEAVRRPLGALLGAGDRAARLRELAGAQDERWLALAGAAFGIAVPAAPAVAALEPDVARQRRRLLLAALLDRLLEPGTLVVAEDAHWLDSASGELLLGLAGRAQRRGWTVVTTRRDVDGGLVLGDAAEQLALSALPAAAARALALGDPDDPAPLPPTVLTELVARAHGNPLFLRELVGAAHAGGAVATLPDSVEALLSARVDMLAPIERDQLRQASVLGTRFRPTLLAAMLDIPVDAVDRALDALDGFLDTRDRNVLFRHALVREAAYEALPFRRRRELHARAGRLVEEQAGDRLDDELGLLSLHYDVAEDAERSWRFSRAAGDQAVRRGSPAEAIVLYERALRAGPACGAPTGALVDVAEARGDAAELAGMFDAAAGAYAAARKLAKGDDARLAELCRKEGRLRERSATFAQALRWYSRGLKHVEALGPDAESERLAARLVLARGAALLRQGRLTESLAPLERAAADAQRLGDLPSLAHASYLLDWACTDLGRPDERHRTTALAIYEELDDNVGLGNVLNNLGINAYYEGDWEEAIRLYERCREARVRAGDVVRLVEPLNNIGEVRSDQGHYAEAEAALREARTLARASTYHGITWTATSNLGRLAARTGDHERAQRLLSDAIDGFERIGGAAHAAEARARVAEAHALAGSPTHALAAATAARDGAIPVVVALLERITGWAWLLAGDPPAAMRAFDASLALAREAGAPFEEALTLDAACRVRPDAAASARCSEILSGLGVIRIPRPPLP